MRQNVDLAPAALTYSNLTPQRDLFDKRGFKQSTASARNCCDTKKEIEAQRGQMGIRIIWEVEEGQQINFLLLLKFLNLFS